MSNGTRALLDQAISLVQQGDLETGKRLLASVLRQEPNNVDAWLWLATAVDDLAQRADCLRRVLAISPHNKIAWSRLADLTSESPARDRPQTTGYQGLEFQCPKCGGSLNFQVGEQALVCRQCGHVEAIEQPAAEVPAYQQETPIHVILPSRQAHADVGGSMVVTCRRCGSTTTWSARHGTVECPFCGTDVVLHAAAEFSLIMPQGLVPFQVDEKGAREAVKKWWGKGWFRPPSLAKRAAVMRFRGVYIPFWTFDNLYRIQWTEKSGNNGFIPGEERDHLKMFDDTLVCGSFTMPEATARGLEPFDTRALVLYQPAYLAGWPAEVSQLSMADASIRARERMVRVTRDEFPVGARVTELATEYMTYKHILLPVWVGEYRYRGRTYAFAVNGQTGKVSGAVPRSLALLLDLMAGAGILLPFGALAFALLLPPSEWRMVAIVGALALWLVVLAVYFLTMIFGWRDADFGTAVREAPERFRDGTLSPETRQAVTEMVNDLSGEPEHAGGQG